MSAVLTDDSGDVSDEMATVLGLSKAGARSRYLRALKRVREILARIPGFTEL
jgi:hypothetical protein